MQIKNATYIVSNPNYASCPSPDMPEYAFIGRSNVGKSSLINMLCARQKLAKTSATPGKTQLINHFLIDSVDEKKKVRKWYLVDLPGYGYAKIAQRTRRTWGQMIENYIRKRENLINLFVLIDSRHQPQKIDIEFIQQLGVWQIPFSIIFTKADKEKPTVVKKNVDAFIAQLQTMWEELPNYIVTSSVKKTGREELLALIERYNESLETA